MFVAVVLSLNVWLCKWDTGGCRNTMSQMLHWVESNTAPDLIMYDDYMQHGKMKQSMYRGFNSNFWQRMQHSSVFWMSPYELGTLRVLDFVPPLLPDSLHLWPAVFESSRSRASNCSKRRRSVEFCCLGLVAEACRSEGKGPQGYWYSGAEERM